MIGELLPFIAVAVAGGGVGYVFGLWHGTPKFLKCAKDGARLRGLCPHCKREQAL